MNASEILAIAAILVSVGLGIPAIYFGRKALQRKQLEYEILASASLLSVANELEGRVKVLLDDEPVSSVHLLIIKIINTGNVPILADDFVEPIRCEFGDGVFLQADVEEVKPEGMLKQFAFLNPQDYSAGPAEIQKFRLPPTVSKPTLIFFPFLMNSGDFFTIKLLIYGPPEFVVKGRVVGVSEIRERARRPYHNLSIDFGPFRWEFPRWEFPW